MNELNKSKERESSMGCGSAVQQRQVYISWGALKKAQIQKKCVENQIFEELELEDLYHLLFKTALTKAAMNIRSVLLSGFSSEMKDSYLNGHDHSTSRTY